MSHPQHEDHIGRVSIEPLTDMEKQHMPPWLVTLGLSGIVATYLYRKYGSNIPAWFDSGTGSASFEGQAPTDFQKILYHAISLQPSQYALDFIRQFEKWSPARYDASNGGGDWTIGWGHKLSGPNDPLWNAILDQATQGDQLFQQDVQNAVSCLHEWVQVPLSQSQFDALTSFVFNLGCYSFVHGGHSAPSNARSHILQYLNAGDYANAAAEFTKWIYAGNQIDGGLVDRRVAEQATFSTGTA